MTAGGEAVAAPDYVDPVVGYRIWRLGPIGLLYPVAAPPAFLWRPGPNQAVCLRHFRVRRREPDPSHPAPQSRCGCGLYAFTDPADRRLRLGDCPPGAVVAWGDIEVHRGGYRAQHAQIVALGERSGLTDVERFRLRGAASRYGVPLVPADELREHALEHGTPLPPHAFPAPRSLDPGQRSAA